MATLVVLGQPSPGLRHVIHEHRHAVLGRDPTCDVVLKKQSVSRFHAQVLMNSKACYLEDMGSTNGTFLNGRKVQKRVELHDGDRILVHDVPLAFFLADELTPEQEESTVQLPLKDSGLPKTDVEMPVAVGTPGPTALKGRLETLIEMTRNLGSSLDIAEILPRVLDLLFRMFPQAKIGEIYLLSADNKLQPVAMKHGREADSTDLTGAPFNIELIQRVFESGRGEFHSEPADDPHLALEEFCQSTVCAPITGPAASPLGVILLETDDWSHMFGEEDLELVAAVAVLAGQAISYSQAHEIVLEHAKSVRHLETARAVQLGMLPRERPVVPGYAFQSYYSAAEKVGGDYFFYEKTRDGRVILGIADASGKGLPAAMNIVRFAGEVRLRIVTSPTLKAAVSSLNEFVMAGPEECMFITACMCVLDPHQHAIAVANVGHPPPLLKRYGSNTVEALTSPRRSFPFGIHSDLDVHPLTVTLEPGDQVILFTDGVSEAMNPRSQLYGVERLSQLLQSAAGHVDAQVSRIVADVEAFRAGRAPSDDMTIVAVERLLT